VSGTPRFSPGYRLPTGSAAVIMAGGIFGAVALQALPHGPLFTKPLAVLLALGWLAIAALIALDAARDGIVVHTRSLLGSFAIGTWVAASAVVARLAMFVVGSLIWVWFVPRALRNLAHIAGRPAGETRPTGVILLTTVATQAVALPAFRLFAAVPPVRSAAALLMGLGFACYLVGAALILRRYVAGARWRLATDWDNTNCILHGALSITGLTAVVSGLFGAAVLAPFWATTVAVFAVVEAAELARLVARVRAFGWREAVLVYDVSQWARNFTFGMFYAFTAAVATTFTLDPTYPTLAALAAAILACGQYVVLLLLLAELALMAGALVGNRLRTAASSRRAG
jgi:hypothetical protein